MRVFLPVMPESPPIIRCAWINGLSQNVPVILESQAYKDGGALFITWDEAEDSGKFSDRSDRNVCAFAICQRCRQEGLQQFDSLRP